MPDPVALVTVIQLTELVAVQEQLVPVVTDSELVLPLDGTETDVGVTVAVHWASAVCTPKTKTSATSRPQNRSFIVTCPLVLSGTAGWPESSARLHVADLLVDMYFQ
jgi:hypothetical protein